MIGKKILPFGVNKKPWSIMKEIYKTMINDMVLVQ